jgi:hypothetical protein
MSHSFRFGEELVMPIIILIIAAVANDNRKFLSNNS